MPKIKRTYYLTETGEPLGSVEGESLQDLIRHRRSLLAHLLQSEGLPGVEEIEGLRTDVDNSYSEGYEAGFSEGYGNGSEDGYERGYEQGLNDGPEPDDTALAKIRQSRLSELLADEARERVESVTPDSVPITKFRISGGPVWVGLTRENILVGYGMPETYEEQYDSLVCYAAALAEKRRREGEVSDG